jgi:hypothetical protein
LPTKDHFSSNCASLVLGGKSHEFVVDLLGVGAGDRGQAGHRILVDPDQATGLAYPTTLVQMLQDREGLLLREFAAVQRRARAFREAFLAGPTGQDSAVFLGPVAEANPQVVAAALAIVGAVGILAAEVFQVVHRVSSRSKA